MPPSSPGEVKLRLAALGYAHAPRLASLPECARLRALFPVRGDIACTQVEPLDREVALAWDVTARAQSFIASIVGGPSRLEFAQWYCKAPESSSTAIPWHQDRAFWSGDRPWTLTSWVALDASDEPNGCLVAIPGSQGPAELRPHDVDGATGIRSCAAADSDSEVVLAVDEGSGLIYHERLVHRSGANGTAAPRRALVLGWAAR